MTSASSTRCRRAKLFEALKKFDCVVVTGPFTDAQIKELRDAGIRVADARDVSPGQYNFVVSTDQPSAEQISAVYTGVVPIVYKAQRALLDNLMQSTFWSFVTITPLLMFVSRSVAGGAVAMMPNVLPVLVIFGAMGWLGINVDIGSMMSASIALGVAVDDTIHFLTWYRGDLDRLRDRRAAIRTAYRHCASAHLAGGDDQRAEPVGVCSEHFHADAAVGLVDDVDSRLPAWWPS